MEEPFQTDSSNQLGFHVQSRCCWSGLCNWLRPDFSQSFDCILLYFCSDIFNSDICYKLCQCTSLNGRDGQFRKISVCTYKYIQIHTFMSDMSPLWKQQGSFVPCFKSSKSDPWFHRTEDNWRFAEFYLETVVTKWFQAGQEKKEQVQLLGFFFFFF